MADNNREAALSLEEATADWRRLEAEKARARVKMQRCGSGEAMGRYQEARAAVENARHRERITRQEIEQGRAWDVRLRVKMAELWRRVLRLEEARTWKLAFMWAASTADQLAEETARAALELEQLQGAGQVAGASLPAAEERYRQLVLKLGEMQAIERALERQVLRGWRWRKVWGAVRRAAAGALPAGARDLLRRGRHGPERLAGTTGPRAGLSALFDHVCPRGRPGQGRAGRSLVGRVRAAVGLAAGPAAGLSQG